MAKAEKIGPKEARQHMDDNDALLVCAYDDQEKFENNHLEGAMSLSEFKSHAGSLSKDRELIFYCA